MQFSIKLATVVHKICGQRKVPPCALYKGGVQLEVLQSFIVAAANIFLQTVTLKQLIILKQTL